MSLNVLNGKVPSKVPSKTIWGSPGDYSPRDLERVCLALGLERFAVVPSDAPYENNGVLYIQKPPLDYLPHAHIRQYLDPKGCSYLGEDNKSSHYSGEEQMEEPAKYRPKPVKTQNFKPKEGDSTLVEKAASIHIDFEPDGFPGRLLVMSPSGIAGEYLLAKKPKPPFEIIGITGRKRSGKDTLADEFVNLGYDKLSFSAPMKRMLQVILGHIQDDKKEEVLPEFGVSYRHMAQTLGTEWGRNLINPDMWIKLLERQLRPGGKYVISDVRFENEANFIRELDGQLIHVLRDTDGSVDAHSSESGVAWVLGDQSLRNKYAYSVYKESCAYLAKKIVEGRSRT